MIETEAKYKIVNSTYLKNLAQPLLSPIFSKNFLQSENGLMYKSDVKKFGFVIFRPAKNRYHMIAWFPDGAGKEYDFENIQEAVQHAIRLALMDKTGRI